ncbi:hypothetical protein CSOJ01_15637, partial [Colletotrichum sojae]
AQFVRSLKSVAFAGRRPHLERRRAVAPRDHLDRCPFHLPPVAKVRTISLISTHSITVLRILTPAERQPLDDLQLCLNAPEPVLICRPCGYALKPFGERVGLCLPPLQLPDGEPRPSRPPHLQCARLQAVPEGRRLAAGLCARRRITPELVAERFARLFVCLFVCLCWLTLSPDRNGRHLPRGI